MMLDLSLFARTYPRERLERVKIKMRLDKSASKRHLAAVKTLAPGAQLTEGDLLRVEYKFCIEYYQQTVQQLEALRVICADPSVVLEVNCDVLQQGHLLVYDVLKKLEQLIETVRTRDA